jgi:Na+/phosphate symporter
MLGGWIVVLIALAGLVIYAMASNPKAQRVGEILFFCGTLATCLALAGKVTRLL